MKVAELLESRRLNWQQLEQLCAQFETRARRKLGAGAMSRFAALYRAACADLALADAYQLPPNTVQYLHQLVGRAHNQLYRSRMFALKKWGHALLVDVPQRVFNDRCVQLVFCLFWFVFMASFYMSSYPEQFPNYGESIVTRSYIFKLENDFARPLEGRDAEQDFFMAGYYIRNNTGIGLKCFAGGLLVVPGLITTVFSAAFFGGMFGYMSREGVDAGVNFFHFVTAHGPFELTAIVLSAGAGLRLGMSLIITGGLSRLASLKKTAVEAMPVMGAGVVLFFLAALIEGFLSPSAAPYEVKVAVAILSSGMMMFYFVILGLPRGSSGAAG